MNAFPNLKYVYGTDARSPNLDISIKCTNRCVFCSRRENSGRFLYHRNLNYGEEEPDKKQVMEEIKRAIDCNPVSEVWITGLGEPLLRLEDAVLDLIPRIKGYDPRVRVGIITNGHAGMVFEKKGGSDYVAQSLKKAGLWRIIVSLNAETAEKYGRLCVPDGRMLGNRTVEQIYEGITDFIISCKNAKLETRVSIVDKLPPDLIDAQYHPDVNACRELVRKLLGMDALNVIPFACSRKFW
ncbi:MAG: radical SAM protein [Candidatus Woesearchaeota archaeon]